MKHLKGPFNQSTFYFAINYPYPVVSFAQMIQYYFTLEKAAMQTSRYDAGK